MAHRHSYDLERRQELHNAIDELPVPDDHSNSDISGDFDRSRSYPEEFANSVNSSIPRDSDLPRESDPDLSQQQANRVMDWSQMHITPTEGRFPQVSAPTMEIESEGNEFELGDRGDFEEHSGFNEPISAVEAVDDSSKDKSLDLDSIRPTDLPLSQPKRLPEVSAERQSSQIWFLGLSSGRRASKQSLPPSGNTSEVHGSALLSGPNISHHGDSAYRTVLDHSVMQDELYKLKNAYAQVKTALKEEQNAHFQADQVVIESKKAISMLESQLADAHSQSALLRAKAKDPASLEELRGRQLSLALAELNRLKGALAEKESEIVGLKHALSLRLVVENVPVRDSDLGGNWARKEAEMNELVEGLRREKETLEANLEKMQDLRKQTDLRGNKEAKQWQDQLLSCQNEVKRLQLEAESAPSLAEMTALQAQVGSLLRENNALQEAQSSSRLKSSYEALAAKLKRQEEAGTKKAEEWQRLEQQLRSQADSASLQCDQLEAKYQQEIDKLALALTAEGDKSLTSARENRRLQSNFQDLKEQKSLMASEIADLKDQLSQLLAQNEDLKTSEKRKKAADSPHSRRSRKPSIDPQRIEEFSLQIDALKADQEKLIQNHESEKVRFEQELKQMRLKRDDLKRELLETRADCEILRKENRDLRGKRREMTITEEFEAKLSEFGVGKLKEPLKISEFVQVSIEIEQENAKMRELEEEIAALQQENELLTRQIDTKTVSTNTENWINDQIVIFQQQIRQFQVDLDASRQKETKLVQEIAKLDEVISDLETSQAEKMHTAMQKAAIDLNKLCQAHREELERAKQEAEAQLAEVQEDWQSEREVYQRRQEELKELHEQYKATAGRQREEEAAQLIREKEEEFSQKLAQSEAQFQAHFEEQLSEKEKQLEEIRKEVDYTVERERAEVGEKLLSEHNSKVERLKQEHLRTKRDLEREVRKLQEENATFSEKSEVGVQNRILAERKETEKLMKSRLKSIQEKQQSDLAAAEIRLKTAYDKSLSEVVSHHKAQLRQKEDLIEQLRRDQEELGAHFDLEKAQLVADFERKVRNFPASLVGSWDDLPFGKGKPEFRISRSGFQDSVLTINDFRADESEVAFIAPNSADRVAMLKEDIRSCWVEEGTKRFEQKLVEKGKIQKFVEIQCQAARESEQKLVLEIASEEVSRLLTGTGIKPRNEYRELAGRLGVLFGRIRDRIAGEYEGRVKELKGSQETVLLKYRQKLGQMETLILQKGRKEASPLPIDSEEGGFLQVGGKLYISLQSLLEELVPICDQLDSFSPLLPKKPSNPQLKDLYRQTILSLQAHIEPFQSRPAKDSTVQCSLGQTDLERLIDEYEEKLQSLHEDLEEATSMYTQSVRSGGTWETEREALVSELETARVKLREWEDTPAIMPEMLTPHETCDLVLSIFTRSNRATFLKLMMSEHPEFLTMLQEFVEEEINS